MCKYCTFINVDAKLQMVPNFLCSVSVSLSQVVLHYVSCEVLLEHMLDVSAPQS